MTAKEILNGKLKDERNFCIAGKYTLLEYVLIEAMEEYAQQKIDEACKKQREADAEIFKGYCTLGKGELFAYEDDFNIYCKILANAPLDEVK